MKTPVRRKETPEEFLAYLTSDVKDLSSKRYLEIALASYVREHFKISQEKALEAVRGFCKWTESFE